MSGHSWSICGHQRATALLAGEIREQRIRHAYLITGPAGIGKSAVADAFARSLICSRATNGTACGECDDCRRAVRGLHPDVQRFSLETQANKGNEKSSGDAITIETVRELSSVSALRAYTARFRVIILADASTMTEIAQEALLKTLEEPPPQLVLILLADRVESLLPTIRSRCEHVSLSPVPSGTLATCLESRGVDSDKSRALATLAQGSPGWAFRALDDDSLVQERSNAIDRASDWVAASPFDRIVRSFELANEFAKAREPVFSEMGSVVEYWRAVMMRAAGIEAGNGDQSGTSDLPRFSLNESYRALVSVTQCVVDLERNVRPRLALEAMVMQWPVNSRGLK